MYKLFLFDMDGVLLRHKSSFQYLSRSDRLRLQMVL